MAYIYQADTWCDACGDAIKARIASETPDAIPEDPDDERTYDSDTYPKWYDAENEESDGPENCADGSCGGQYVSTNPGDARYLSVGRYGTFLENRLTTDGYRTLKAMLDKHGEHLPSHAREWANYYQFEYHANEFASAHNWLMSKQVCPYLVALMADGKVDGDAIQDVFQDEMDADGYFKVSGWYSPEYDESETEERNYAS